MITTMWANVSSWKKTESAVGEERDGLNLSDGARSAVTSSPAVGRVEIPVVDLLWQESGNRLLPSAARPAVPAQRVRGGLGSAGVAARHEKWGRVAQWGPASASCHPTSCSHSLPLLARNQAKSDWRSTSDHVKVTCEHAVKKWTSVLIFFLVFIW